MVKKINSLEELGADLASIVSSQIGMKLENDTLKLAYYQTPEGKDQMLAEGYEKMSYKDLTLLCKSKIEQALVQNGNNLESLKKPITQIATSLAGYRDYEVEKRDSFFGTCHRIFLRALQFLSFAGVITIPVGFAIGKKIQEDDPEQNENSKYIFKKFNEV